MSNVIIDTNKCKACDLCVRACPKKLLKLGNSINSNSYQYVVITDDKECVSCGNCAVSCPDRVLSVFQNKTA